MKRDDDEDRVPSAEERTRAHALAARIDALMAGAPLPPALEAEERELLEAAASIHEALAPDARAAAHCDRLLEEVFSGRPVRVARADAPIPIRRLRRAAPWLVAAASLAACLLLALWPAGNPPPARTRDVHTCSRPADALVGPIGRAEAGDASRRLDVVYADRMVGYRSVILSTRRPSP